MFRPNPSFLITVSFFLVILLGGILLSLPISSAQGIPTNFLDAYFTSNSATCVTGLVTLDTGVHFSLFGLIVIILLMQVGGLGYMTFSTFIMLVFRQRLLISQKLAIQEALNIYSTRDVLSVLRKIFGIVFLVEGVGALILFLRWLPELGLGKAFFYAIFHSVSAFNNAGFALPANYANLCPYATDWTINLTITSLIIIGGIGFIVIADILERRRLSLHSKVVIFTTLCLIIGGTLAFLLLEFHNAATIASLPFHDKVLVSYFQAVTPRTAGFNTVDTAKYLPATALFTMFLMFVGASPGGTGGGVKTSTFALILATIRSTLKSMKNTILFGRRVPPDTVRRAFTVTFLAIALVAIAIFILRDTEKAGLLEIAFEVFSAFGTVGLSMGLTPYLSSIGKIVIIVVMFIGRVGPVTLLLSLSMQQKEHKIEPPTEGISIG
jgi:trk system potassium uptake protein TrkH